MNPRPNKPVVIYDGACGICAGNLKWLYRLDTFKKFDAMPYQADELLAFFPALKMEDCQNAMDVSDRTDPVYPADSMALAKAVPTAGPQSVSHRRSLRSDPALQEPVKDHSKISAVILRTSPATPGMRLPCFILRRSRICWQAVLRPHSSESTS